jgi:hypothetical protein
MRVIACCALIIHVAAGVARSQTFSDLQIQLGAYRLMPDGGEKPVGVWLSTGPVVIGRPVAGTFSFGSTCNAFAVSSVRSEVREDATTAWHVEVTPVRVVRDAVTFRLRWVRVAALKQQLDQISFDSGKPARSPSEEIELTLRPGESWPVDSVRVPSGAKTVHGQTCGPTASIRVLVNTYPRNDEERRLVVADLWLVERLSNGTEAQRSEPLSIRGLPNRSFQFYFDSIVAANVPLDIFGTLVTRLESGAMAVSIETRCRWPRAPDSNVTGPQRSVKSEIQVKPAEIVEIRLPRLDDDAGPFAKREFSIRIRMRQLR